MHWRACEGKAKPKTESCPARENGNKVTLTQGETVSMGNGMHGVGGDRMAGSWSDMNQGSRSGKGTAFMACGRPEEPCPEGDRASVVVPKRGNARGAEGGGECQLYARGRGGQTFGLGEILQTPFTHYPPTMSAECKGGLPVKYGRPRRTRIMCRTGRRGTMVNEVTQD